MATFQAEVSEIGNEFVWSFPGKHTVSLLTLRTALVQHNFDPKSARQLCERHAFLRAVRHWLKQQNGGRVDHTISDITDHRVNETKFTLSIQIDECEIVAQSVNYQRKFTLSVDKLTGDVTAKNPDGTSNDTIKTEFEQILPMYQVEKNTVDLNNLVKRLFDSQGNFVLIPACGTRANGETFRKRGVWFVLSRHTGILDRVAAFIQAIGGDVERNPVYSFSPLPATPSNPYPVSVPAGQASVVVRSLFEEICDKGKECEKKIDAHFRKQWKGEKCKAKAFDSLFAEIQTCLDMIAYAKNSFGTTVPDIVNTYNEILSDHIEAVRLAMVNAYNGQPWVRPAPVDNTTVSYIPDETDDISMIQVIHTHAL